MERKVRRESKTEQIFGGSILRLTIVINAHFSLAIGCRACELQSTLKQNRAVKEICRRSKTAEINRAAHQSFP
jgi:hypothetical protein